MSWWRWLHRKRRPVASDEKEVSSSEEVYRRLQLYLSATAQEMDELVDEDPGTFERWMQHGVGRALMTPVLERLMKEGVCPLALRNALEREPVARFKALMRLLRSVDDQQS